MIPYDPEAEAEVCGVAVATTVGYLAAANVVLPSDFYVPPHGRIFAACGPLATMAPTWDYGNRIDAVAKAAQVERTIVATLVRGRSLMWDRAGRFARRVAELAESRARLEGLAAEYRQVRADGAELLRTGGATGS